MLNLYITVVLLGLSIILPRNRIIVLTFFLFMWSLWGWNTWNGDYELYEFNYNNSKDFEKEIGFSLLSYVCNSLGLSFQEFMILSSGLILSVMYKLSIKYCAYPGVFAFVYFFVFLQGFVYLRNYYMLVIILFGLLRSVESSRPKLILGISIIISLAFHSSAFLYFIFMLGISNERLRAKKILLVSIVLFFATYILFNFVTMFVNTTSFASRLEYYGGDIHFGTSILFHFLFVLFFLFIDSKLQHNASLTKKDTKILTLVYNFNLLSLLFLPIYILVPYLPNRFICFLVLVNLFYLMSIIRYCFKKGPLLKYSFIYFLSLCSVSLAMLYVSTIPYTIIPLYMCNMIWGDDYTLHNLNVIDRF